MRRPYRDRHGYGKGGCHRTDLGPTWKKRFSLIPIRALDFNAEDAKDAEVLIRHEESSLTLLAPLSSVASEPASTLPPPEGLRVQDLFTPEALHISWDDAEVRFTFRMAAMELTVEYC